MIWFTRSEKTLSFFKNLAELFLSKVDKKNIFDKSLYLDFKIDRRKTIKTKIIKYNSLFSSIFFTASIM